MTTATVEQIQQEYKEHIADRVDAWLTNKTLGHCGAGKGKAYYSDQVFYERGLEETKDLAIASARAAGLEKEADHISQCGKSYSVSRCDDCGEFVGHPYHCDEPMCPICHYRNLFRFMNRHREAWDIDQDFLLVTIDYGGFRSYSMEDGFTYAKEKHKQLIRRFPLLAGGIYHRELKWDEEYHLCNILYHYLLNADVNYTFYFILALNGEALLEDYRTFTDYDTAQSYFIRHCCKYPADILLDCTKVAWYLGLVKRQKLIQGFGALYRVTGGLNRGTKDRRHPSCPVCGGKLSYVGLTTKDYVFWDDRHKYYKVDPGAPGL